MRGLLWLVLGAALGGFEPFRRANPLVAQGNREYQKKRHDKALESYRQASKSLPGDASLAFNEGTALLALKRTNEAIESLQKAARSGAGAKAHYNLGNAYLSAQRPAEAIEAYRRALQLDPRDKPAKWNLELALRMKEQEEKKKQKQQGQEQQTRQKQDEPKQDPQQQDPGQDQEEKPGQEQEQSEEQDPARRAAQPDPDDRAKADQSVLDAIERNEKNLQTERLRALYRRRRVEKDW